MAAYGKEMPELTRGDFENLLAFRTSLRRFLHWSQTRARAAGLTPAQHQLLVAIKGHPGGQEPTIGDLAGYLLLRHHSAVEQVDRLVEAGFVVRQEAEDDARKVMLELTDSAEELLKRLSADHLEELRRVGPSLSELFMQFSGRPSGK